MSRIRRRRGSSAIEFTLLLPVFAGMVSGVVDYGYFLLVRAAADTAVYQGARSGADFAADDDAKVAAAAEVVARVRAANLSVPDPVVAVTFVDGQIDVSLSLQVPPLLGLVPVPTLVESSSRLRRG
jgi:Flp pilus assembly protein TadG